MTKPKQPNTFKLYAIENKIRKIAQAIIEQQKHTQLSEQTLNELETIANQLERY